VRQRGARVIHRVGILALPAWPKRHNWINNDVDRPNHLSYGVPLTPTIRTVPVNFPNGEAQENLESRVRWVVMSFLVFDSCILVSVSEGAMGPRLDVADLIIKQG